MIHPSRRSMIVNLKWAFALDIIVMHQSVGAFVNYVVEFPSWITHWTVANTRSTW
jgi:hypothetical protein